MTDEGLKEWIEKSLAHGTLPEIIKQKLLSQGWPESDVNDVMSGMGSMPGGKSSSKTWILVILVAILVVAAVGIVLLQAPADTASNQDTGITTERETTELDAFDCDVSQNCFEEKFSDCEPAKVKIELFETLAYYYEIIGKDGSYCEVESKFLANPNPAFVEKEMVCDYDNTKDFESAITDMSRCEGELYDLMTGGGTQTGGGDTQSSSLGSSCSGHIECDSGQYCNNGRCELDVNECTDSGDCSVCENCDDGKETCAGIQNSMKCIDCLVDSMCKDGYFCDDYTYSCAECSYMSHCGEGELCLYNECKTEEEAYATWDSCNLQTDCTTTCDNCVKGQYSGRQFGTSSLGAMVKICIECYDNSDCNMSYVCEKSSCVAE